VLLIEGVNEGWERKEKIRIGPKRKRKGDCISKGGGRRKGEEEERRNLQKNPVQNANVLEKLATIAAAQAAEDSETSMHPSTLLTGSLTIFGSQGPPHGYLSKRLPLPVHFHGLHHWL